MNKPWWEDNEIETLEIPVRTANALHVAGIDTIDKLKNMDAMSIKAIPGIGDHGFRMLKAALRKCV